MFERRNLVVLAFANGFTLWRYCNYMDPLAVIATPGYFLAAEDTLSDGDQIHIAGEDGSMLRDVCIDRGVVTTRPMVQLP